MFSWTTFERRSSNCINPRDGDLRRSLPAASLVPLTHFSAGWPVLRATSESATLDLRCLRALSPSLRNCTLCMRRKGYRSSSRLGFYLEVVEALAGECQPLPEHSSGECGFRYIAQKFGAFERADLCEALRRSHACAG
jgi:hypothetical protein